MYRIIIRCLTLLTGVLLFLMVGCTSSLSLYTYDREQAIAIYRMPSFEKVAFLPYDVLWKQNVISIDESARSFNTIYNKRDESNNEIVILCTIGFDGRIIKEIELPLQSIHRLLGNETCSISPDGRYMVYIDIHRNGLYNCKQSLYRIDLKSLEKTALSEGISIYNDGSCWGKVHYISDTKIAFAESREIKEDNRYIEKSYFAFFDIKTKKFTQNIIPEGYCLNSYEFSRSNKYLAYIIESHEIDKKVKVIVIDTESLKVIVETTSESAPIGRVYLPLMSPRLSDIPNIEEVHWSPDEEKIIFRKNNDTIYSLTLKDNTVHLVHKIPKSSFRWMTETGYINNDSIYYITTGLFRAFPLVFYLNYCVLNVQTGDVEVRWRIPNFQNRPFFVDDGKLLISEVGPIYFD